MIRFIAAIDEKRGMANKRGIPWQGQVPTDVATFRKKTMHSVVLMGYGTYAEFEQPLSDRQNFVATAKDESLRAGFIAVSDARKFLQSAVEDVWVIGGPGLFASTLDLAGELHLTQLEGDFHCTKFFPEFQQHFELAEESKPIQERDIRFTFQTWKRKIVV
jgi:dihydrofolate reductase